MSNGKYVPDFYDKITGYHCKKPEDYTCKFICKSADRLILDSKQFHYSICVEISNWLWMLFEMQMTTDFGASSPKSEVKR